MSFLYDYRVSLDQLGSSAIRRAAVDLCVVGTVYYTGSLATPKIAIAATTGDISLTHGADAADTTFAGNGTCDLSTEGATFVALKRQFDATPNWHLALECVLPGDATEAAGTAKIINNVSATGVPTTGYAILVDTSTALYHAIGITHNGDPTEPHNHDAGVMNVLMSVRATTTYGSGTSIINIYEVNDVAGTSTFKFSIAAGATTVEGGQPSAGTLAAIQSSDGFRIVCKVVNSAAMTAADMTVYFKQGAFGPGMRAAKLWCQY